MVLLRGMISAQGFGWGPTARRNRIAVSDGTISHTVVVLYYECIGSLHQEAQLSEDRDGCD